MLEGGRLSESELVTMLMYTVLGTAYFFLPSVAAAFAGRDFWLTPVLATLQGLTVAACTGYLGARFPGFNLFDWMEILLGRVGGKILQFFYVLWLTHVTGVIVSEFTYFMNTAFLPQTPSLVLAALLLLLAGAAVYGGVEIIGRAALVFLPVSLAITLGLLVLAGGLYDPANLKPFFERGLAPVLAGSMPPGAWRGEVVLGSLLFPCLPRPEKGGWVIGRAVLWIGSLLVLDALALDLAFGADTAGLSLPVFSLAREISLMGFFEHLEGFVLISWVAGVFVKLAVWYFAAMLGTAQFLNLKSYRPLVLPAGLLMLTLVGYEYPDVMLLVHFVASVWPFYGGFFELVPPLGLVILALLRSRNPASRRASPVPGAKT